MLSRVCAETPAVASYPVTLWRAWGGPLQLGKSRVGALPGHSVHTTSLVVRVRVAACPRTRSLGHSLVATRRPMARSLPARANPAPPRGTLNETRWEEIIGVATDVFFERGYAEATIQEVATRAGLVNKGSLYYYIKTKGDLLFAICKRAEADAMEAIEEDEATSQKDAAIRVEAFIERWMDKVGFRGRRTAVVEREWRSLTPDQIRYFEKGIPIWQGFLCSLIQQGIDEGQFRTSINVSAAADSIYTLLNHTYGLYWPTAELSQRDYVNWYRDFILKGITS